MKNRKKPFQRIFVINGRALIASCASYFYTVTPDFHPKNFLKTMEAIINMVNVSFEKSNPNYPSEAVYIIHYNSFKSSGIDLADTQDILGYIIGFLNNIPEVSEWLVNNSLTSDESGIYQLAHHIFKDLLLNQPILISVNDNERKEN